jgi:hypothetical protein
MDNSKLLEEINKELREYIISYEKKKYRNVKKLVHYSILKKRNEIKEKYTNEQLNRLKPQIVELLKKHKAQIKSQFSKKSFNNNNNNNSKGFYSFDEKYRDILQEGMRLYNSNNFNDAFPLLKKAADEGGIPLAATKVATYYLDYSYLNKWSFQSAINRTYIFRSSLDTINSTNGLKKNYKTNIGIAYLFLALARYNTKNEILGMIDPKLIKTALFKVFGIDDKAVKEQIKSIKENEHGWKGYVKKSILDVIEEHKISPTLMKKK